MVNAFEGAVGFGAGTTGGRGGQVVKVTNGNDSGEGSLRWALEQVEGPRIIVFDGVNDIQLDEKIVIRDGDVTIAGQTAGGVQVHGDGISIRADNVIMRGMMIRDAYDPLQVMDANNVIIDHNSIQWGIDENVSIVAENGSTSNITLSNNIIAEAVHDSTHSKGPHSMGLLLREGDDPGEDVDGVTVHANLFAFNNRRNPWMQAGENLEVTNNYTYAPGEFDEAFHLGAPEFPGQTEVQVMNNFVQAGAESNDTDESAFWVRDPGGEFHLSGNLQADVDGNLFDLPIAQGPNADRVTTDGQLFEGSGVPLMNAEDVPEYVLANAGANPLARDATDQRIITQVANGQGGIVNDAQFTALNAPLEYVDGDDDGIADWYEEANGLDMNADDSAGDIDGDGFTNVEEYINGLIDGFGTNAPTPTPVSQPTAPAPTPTPVMAPAPEPTTGEAPAPEPTSGETPTPEPTDGEAPQPPATPTPEPATGEAPQPPATPVPEPTTGEAPAPADEAPTTDPIETGGFAERMFARQMVQASGDTLEGTSGDDVIEGDPMPAVSAALDQPISFFSLANPAGGTFTDATGVSSALFYNGDNNQLHHQTEVRTMPGPDGTPVAYFSDDDDNFVLIPNDPAHQVLNGTIAAWFNPTRLGDDRHTIFAKDELNGGDGGHFNVGIEVDGRLFVRVAEGDGDNGGTYNHEWISTDPVITQDQWQHIAVTIGQDGVAVHLNGEPMGDAAFQAQSSGTPAMSQMTNGYLIGNDKPLIVGADPRYVSDTSSPEAFAAADAMEDEFEGGITDVGIWGGDTPAQALSSGQIAELYANGPGDLTNATAPQPIAVPAGDDTITGADGNDAIDGGAGNDALDGGAGNDNVMGGYGNDAVMGGVGDDELDGGHGEDILDGGEGNDRLVSRADAREPEIAQDFDASDDPDGEIDAASGRLYPSQANMPANDVLTGGAGADAFVIETLINGKLDIINKHVNDDGTIDWMGVAGENDNVHDHWVDGIGDDTITDFNREEGDTIRIEGHTTEVSSIDVRDVDGDGDLDSVLQLRSNQGANGGAHNLDLLGTITVLDNEITADDFTVDASVAYGIVDTIGEYQEAVTPLGLGQTSPAAPLPTAEPAPLAGPIAAPETEAPETEAPEAEAPEAEAPEAEAPASDSPEPTGAPSAPAATPSAVALSSLLASLLTPSAENPESATPSMGDDLLIGTAADETMRGRWGDDRITGDAGDDVIAAGHGDDMVYAGDGDDIVHGKFGDDVLLGGAGQDLLRGNRGSDVLAGNEDGDALYGGAGDDVLYGGEGGDLIDGGRGDDVAVFDGAAENYAVAQVGGGLAFTDQAGETDLVTRVEHVYFSGSGQTFAVENGALTLVTSADAVDDLLEGDLLQAVLNISVGGTGQELSVDAQLAELDETAASEPALPADTGVTPAIAPMDGESPDLGIDAPGQDDLRVA